MTKTSSIFIILSILYFAESAKVCDSYDKFESQTKCGPKGYLMFYGKRNCNNFNNPETRKQFDAVGQKFIDCTSNCLIRYLDQLLNKKSKIGCENLEESAFKSHESCYTSCGFCKVCKTNKKAFFKAYSLSDFFSRRALKQVMAMASECGVFGCF